MLLAYLLGIVYAHGIVYAPVAVYVEPSSTSYVFLDPGTSGVEVSLGADSASANVTVTASNYAQLVKNPEFYSSPDYWYCSPGSYLDCYWLSSDTGSVGGVASINGTIPALSRDTALILQEVTVPNAPISGAYIYVTVRYAVNNVLLTYWFAGLYDPSTGNSYVSTSLDTPSTYTTYVIDVTNNVQPGKTYYVIVGVSGLTLFSSGSIDFRIDSVYFYVYTEYYVFSNTILSVNATSASSPTVYARLVIDSASLDPGLNATLYLVNVTSSETTAISITNGVANASSTGWIMLGPAGPGYSSGYIELNVSKASLTNSTLNLFLELCTGGSGIGVCGYYPIQLVIDPAAHGIHGAATTLEARPASPKLSSIIAEAVMHRATIKVLGAA